MAINDQKMGWVDKPREVDLIKSQMQHPLFSGAAPLLKGTGKGKSALLHKYFTQLGIPFPLRHQTESDCVSMGTALAVDTRKVAEIIQGERESWVAQTSTEDIYSGSRMIIGGGRISGGGSVGIWAAKYINKNNYGTLIRKKYPFADLTTYSGQRAAQWGNQKQSQALLDEAKLHPIGDFTSIENYEDVCDALYNDYPVIVCSQQGFSSTRDEDGFARPQGSWAHCYHPNSWIYGPNINRLSDANSGDIVYDQDGKLVEIESITKRQYNGKMINIKSSSGEHLVTEDHIFLIKTNGSNLVSRPYLNYKDGKKYQNSKIEFDILTMPVEVKDSLIFVAAKDLQKSDTLIMPRIELPNSCIIPDYEYKSTSNTKLPKLIINDELAWFFGLYAGDGYSIKNHKIKIIQNSDDIDKIDRAVLAIKNNFGLTAHVYKRKEANAVDIVVYNAQLANFMKKWFDMKKNKQFPAWLLNSKFNIMSLIDGFCDADGTKIKNKNGSTYLQISNTSEKIINQVYLVLTSVGMSPSRWKSISSGTGSYKSDSLNYFIGVNTSKVTNSRFEECKIKSVDESEYYGEVISLETSNSHTYICNGSVSHNCMCFIAFDDEYKRPGVLCVNSWGPSWISGPKRHDQPEGSFWVDPATVNRMCSMGDTFSIANFDGFKIKPDARVI